MGMNFKDKKVATFLEFWSQNFEVFGPKSVFSHCFQVYLRFLKQWNVLWVNFEAKFAVFSRTFIWSICDCALWMFASKKASEAVLSAFFLVLKMVNEWSCTILCTIFRSFFSEINPSPSPPTPSFWVEKKTLKVYMFLCDIVCCKTAKNDGEKYPPGMDDFQNKICCLRRSENIPQC